MIKVVIAHKTNMSTQKQNEHYIKARVAWVKYKRKTIIWGYTICAEKKSEQEQLTYTLTEHILSIESYVGWSEGNCTQSGISHVWLYFFA